jgi:putative hydrolases of HD superfamily
MTEESKKRLEEQIRFIMEIDKEKNIFRQTSLTGRTRKENDAEHAWHMAIMAYLLKEYANEPFDLAHTMMMCLIHDIVEIDAGDTYAYDEENKKSQKEREEKAAERIFGLLPEDQGKEIYVLFEEFEANETPEAHFAHAMDNFQPLLLNDSNDGADWEEHKVSRQQVDGRQMGTSIGSAFLYEKTKEILDKHEAAGHFRKVEEDK